MPWAACVDSSYVRFEEIDELSREERVFAVDIEGNVRMENDVIMNQERAKVNEQYFIPSRSHADRNSDSVTKTGSYY